MRIAGLKSAIKTCSKKLLKAVDGKNPEEAREALARAIPTIQRASSKKVIHKKTAARKISRLTKKVSALTIPA